MAKKVKTKKSNKSKKKSLTKMKKVTRSAEVLSEKDFHMSWSDSDDMSEGQQALQNEIDIENDRFNPDAVNYDEDDLYY